MMNDLEERVLHQIDAHGPMTSRELRRVLYGTTLDAIINAAISLYREGLIRYQWSNRGLLFSRVGEDR